MEYGVKLYDTANCKSTATVVPSKNCGIFAKGNDGNTLDYQNYKYVGWHETIESNPGYRSLFTDVRLKQMQDKITYLLTGVAERPILVPIKTITGVMVDIFQTRSPEIGSIYSRYIQPDTEGMRDDLRDLVDQTIQVIVSTIRTEYEMTKQNNKLSVWSTVYGEFNKEGLQSYPTSMIKLNNRKNTAFMFFENY
jgi:hypothetical protein